MISVSRQVLIFIVVLVCFSAQAGEYTRNVDFSPVRLTLDKAAELANDVFTYVQKVNTIEKKTKGEVEFKSLRYDATFDLPLTPEDLKKSPDRVFGFTVKLRSEGNSINYVVLSFQDRTRSLNISGQNYDYINGLISLVNDRVEQHHVLFGGLYFRIFAAIVVFIIVLSGYYVIVSRFEGFKVLTIAVVMLIIVPNAIFYLFPWERIFPGTLITRGESTPLEQYAPLFTFLSFLLSIALIVWQLVSVAKKRSKRIS
jgi:hypothetical protein